MYVDIACVVLHVAAASHYHLLMHGQWGSIELLALWFSIYSAKYCYYKVVYKILLLYTYTEYCHILMKFSLWSVLIIMVSHYYLQW